MKESSRYIRRAAVSLRALFLVYSILDIDYFEIVRVSFALLYIIVLIFKNASGNSALARATSIIRIKNVVVIEAPSDRFSNVDEKVESPRPVKRIVNGLMLYRKAML